VHSVAVWCPRIQEVNIRKLFFGPAPGFIQHLTKLLPIWFSTEANECDPGLVFVGISSRDVEPLVWSDGVTGCGSAIVHIDMFELGGAGIRVGSVSAICPHQPLQSNLHSGSRRPDATEKPFILKYRGGLRAHQSNGLDIARSIFCPVGAHGSLQIPIQCFQRAGMCCASNRVHLSTPPRCPLIEQDFPGIAS
jgi:hypothetical protein